MNNVDNVDNVGNAGNADNVNNVGNAGNVDNVDNMNNAVSSGAGNNNMNNAGNVGNDANDDLPTKIFSPTTHVRLEASAGSGKTTSLVLRLLVMLMDDDLPKGVLCVTYTNEAVKSIVHRLNDVLVSFAQGNFRTESGGYRIEFLELQRYFATTDTSMPEGAEAFFQERAQRAFSFVVNQPHRLRVNTVHSFFASIIKLFPYHVGIGQGSRLVKDSATELQIINQAMNVALSSVLSRVGAVGAVGESSVSASSDYGVDVGADDYVLRFMDTLSVSHYSLINYLEQLQKLSLPLHRYAPPESVFSLLESTLLEAEDVFAGIFADLRTFISLINMPSLDKRESVQVDKLVSVVESEDWNLLLSLPLITNRNMHHGHMKKVEFLFSGRDSFDSALQGIRRYVELRQVGLELFGRLFSYYYNRGFYGIKRKNGVYFYSDIVEEAHKLLVGNRYTSEGGEGSAMVTTSEPLYFKLDATINHILMDEFQDTSLKQVEVFIPLMNEALSGMGQWDSPGSLFFVGDTKQLLYRFQGAEPGLFDHTVELLSMERQGVDEIIYRGMLNTNYRSSRCVVEFVNDIFMYLNSVKIDGVPYTLDYTPQGVHSSLEGYVSYQVVDKTKDEVSFIVDCVEQCLAKGFEYGQITILHRTNSNARTNGDALAALGYPVRKSLAVKLLNTELFHTFLALMRYVVFRNQYFLLQYVCQPSTIIADDGADTDTGANIHGGIMSTMDSVGEEIVSTMADAPNITSGLLTLLEKHGFYHRYPSKADYNKLISLMGNAPDTGNMFEYMTAMVEMADSESSSTSDADAITFMTIHNAKGLEFPVVIIPSVNFEMDLNGAKTASINYQGRGVPVLSKKELIHLKERNDDGFIVGEDSKYLEPYKSEAARIRNDSLFRLYVALTRAKYALFVRQVDDSATGGSTYKTGILSHFLTSIVMGSLENPDAHDADVAEPAESAESAEPAEPAEPVESAESAESAEPAEPAESAESAEPAESVESADVADVAEPAEPADVADVADVAEPASNVGYTTADYQNDLFSYYLATCIIHADYSHFRGAMDGDVANDAGNDGDGVNSGDVHVQYLRKSFDSVASKHLHRLAPDLTTVHATSVTEILHDLATNPLFLSLVSGYARVFRLSLFPSYMSYHRAALYFIKPIGDNSPQGGAGLGSQFDISVLVFRRGRQVNESLEGVCLGGTDAITTDATLSADEAGTEAVGTDASTPSYAYVSMLKKQYGDACRAMDVFEYDLEAKVMTAVEHT